MRTEPEPAGALAADPAGARERILRAIRFCLLAFVGLRVPIEPRLATSHVSP